MKLLNIKLIENQGGRKPIHRGLLILIPMSLLYFCYLYYTNTYASHKFLSASLINSSFLVYTPGCHIPKLDPFDSSIMPFYSASPYEYRCSSKLSFLNVKKNAVISLDARILQNDYGITDPKYVNCTYQEITRSNKQHFKGDDHFTRGEETKLVFDVPLEKEFLRVSCFSNRTEILKDFVALAPLKPEVEERCNHMSHNSNSTMLERLNVILIGIDSISKQNFIRHFGSTRQYLKEINAIELHGYTKVDDNTFPNLVPLLTGHYYEYYWNDSMKDMYFDHLSFIWKGFQAQGYRTVMAEDAPNIATFDYYRRGFKDIPTDYYLRALAVALESSDVRKKSKHHCFRHRLEMQFYFDYVKAFTQTMEDRRYFIFDFVARLTHDVLNYAGYADKPSVELIRSLKNSGVLNKSLLIYFSDHGIRFGGIRQTYTGKVEERMPFMYLVLPPWFLEKHPNIHQNLLINQHRLTSPFDIHATLEHLLNGEGKTEDDISEGTSRTPGVSLFNEVHPNRTCATAGIYPHWCTCHHRSPVPVKDGKVSKSAETIIFTVNQWLSKFGEKCANLTLEEILTSYIEKPQTELLLYLEKIGRASKVQNTDVHTDYLVTIRTSPGDALLEATVRLRDGKYSVLDDL